MKRETRAALAALLLLERRLKVALGGVLAASALRRGRGATLKAEAARVEREVREVFLAHDERAQQRGQRTAAGALVVSATADKAAARAAARSLRERYLQWGARLDATGADPRLIAQAVQPHRNVLATTESARAFNRGRQDGFLDGPDPPKRVRWVAELDKTTCDQCERRHGHVYPVGSVSAPPIHPNCRCILERWP